ncbi:MAG: Rab family GTPase [Promethearchaeota archaeon]
MGGKFLFKVILAGSGGCGKTTLLNRFTTGKFITDTKMTIGVDFAVHYLKIPEYGTVTLQIWDFGGEERFRIMLPSFCVGATGCLLFFDLMRPNTFHELGEWIEIIRKNTDNIPIILLGSKYDLLKDPSDLSVSTDEILNFMKAYNINGYLNTSSKTGLNVKEAFEKLTLLMLKS